MEAVGDVGRRPLDYIRGWCLSSEDYFMSSDKQTNKQTLKDYISVRLTLDHSELDELVKVCDSHCSDWCIYKHISKKGVQHFHVCFPGVPESRGRNWIQRAWPDRRGNRWICITSYHNGLRSFVFYCQHEGGYPIFKDEEWRPIVDEVIANGVYKKSDDPEQSGTVKKVRERLSNPQLTMSNLLRQSVKFASANDLGSRDLGSVLKRMVNDGWDPDYGLMSKGVPSEYYDIFASRMSGKSIEEQDWMKPHKRKERLSDVPEIDTDYQFTKRTLLIPRPHE